MKREYFITAALLTSGAAVTGFGVLFDADDDRLLRFVVALSIGLGGFIFVAGLKRLPPFSRWAKQNNNPPSAHY